MLCRHQRPVSARRMWPRDLQRQSSRPERLQLLHFAEGDGGMARAAKAVQVDVVLDRIAVEVEAPTRRRLELMAVGDRTTRPDQPQQPPGERMDFLGHPWIDPVAVVKGAGGDHRPVGEDLSLKGRGLGPVPPARVAVRIEGDDPGAGPCRVQRDDEQSPSGRPVAPIAPSGEARRRSKAAPSMGRGRYQPRRARRRLAGPHGAGKERDEDRATRQDEPGGIALSARTGSRAWRTGRRTCGSR